MKISKTKRVIQLGRADTKRWEDRGPDGVDFRRSTRETAHALADVTGNAVEIYASASAGRWMADQIEPAPQPSQSLGANG